jgi:pimeloyl-ACP methyl ester carboxylesterase
MTPAGEDIAWTSADGLSLYAKSYGPEDAPLTVLCIHGLTRNHKDFEPMIAALPARYRFVAVDVRGRGARPMIRSTRITIRSSTPRIWACCSTSSAFSAPR